MLKDLKLNNVFVIDIETVPQKEKFEELPPHLQELWEQKSRYQRKDGQTAVEFYDRAGIWAEFGKVVCISVGIYHLERKQIHLRVCSFAHHDETILLKQFINLINKHTKNLQLCAHNGKEFDFPYLCRRMLINGLPIPAPLQIAGKKPWEIHHLDTMELWKFGDYKNYTSLNLLAAIFDLPTPKNDIDGSQVKEIYYQQKDLTRIAKYCQNDVITTAQLLLRFKGLPIITQENITLVK
ncbi:MAG: 3'-5' exonuclease [Pedobacter sp.]|uniref:3'-5' exonuclease n=1 Tax=Pedobacter sp. TaxID=1411316 RepID=UPI0028071B6F|nr:3'-5' exonuclease [Pedobacter sp.]MDQ8003353.1 3'-5' exonuclease [Pedobacter sp.]